LSPPGDPDDPAPRPLLSLGFWALIALCVLCVLAGVGVAYLGPRLLPPKPQPPRASLAAPQPAAAPAATAADPQEVAALRARITALETAGARSSEAAAASLAAAAVIDASRASRPFASELVSLQQASPDLAELAALRGLAETGAPSRLALAASFPEFAARAAVRARKPPSDAGVGPRVAYALSTVVQVRRVDDLTGSGPDALLARAEHALAEGDVAGALRLIDRLPPAARQAMAPWRDGAARRAEVDRQVAALRARAMQDLAAARGGA